MPSWPSKGLPRVFTILLAVAGILYPFLYYATHQRVPTLAFALLACVLLALRLRLPGAWGSLLRVPVIVALVLVALLTLLDAPLAAKAYPVVMSWSFAAAFAVSLMSPVSLIERFASLRGPVNGAARRYCRRVTLLWAVWLTLNGGIAGYLAIAGRVEDWTLWTGFLSYLVTGVLFAGEFLVRQFLMRRRTAE